MSARCEVKRGGGAVCGSVLVERIDRIGAVHFDCPRCTRRLAGLCADCPRPVHGTVGKAERCAEHKAAAVRAQARNYHRRHAETVSKRRKRRLATYRRRHPALTPSEIGRLAGAARCAALSPERRREIATIAVRVRLANQAARRLVSTPPTTEVAA